MLRDHRKLDDRRDGLENEDVLDDDENYDDDYALRKFLLLL